MFPELDVEATSATLERHGFAPGLWLLCPRLKRSSSSEREAQACKKRMGLCAEINRTAHEAAVVEVVKRYLGVEPILHGTTLFWILPNNSGKVTYPERIHYDIGDLKSVCVCFYLTDVDLECAPHITIAGTHKSKSIGRLFNPFMTDEDASRQFGSGLTTSTGDAGMRFFEDAIVQHKRGKCGRPRLALFIEYTILRKPDTVR